MARIGINPEKINVKQLSYKRHRVIMPFYIPNIEDDYFTHTVDVLRLSLRSLVDTIDYETTCITLINNASCKEASDVAEKFISEGLIDRYIRYEENRGKVEPCLSEVRASYEDYVTIVDADVLFYQGWEKAVFDIFNNIPRAGAVSAVPAPHVAFYHNSSVIINEYLKQRLKWGKFISKDDLMDFAESTGNGSDFYENKKDGFSWMDRQLVIEKNGVVACVGCGHFFTTYKRYLLEKQPKRKVGVVFKNGLESGFIDEPIDKFGYYRLSVTQSYGYHLGNNIVVKELENRNHKNSKNIINNILIANNCLQFIPLMLRRKFVGLYRKCISCKS